MYTGRSVLVISTFLKVLACWAQSGTHFRLLKNISKFIASFTRKISAQVKILKKKMRTCRSLEYRKTLLRKTETLLSCLGSKKWNPIGWWLHGLPCSLPQKLSKNRCLSLFIIKGLERILVSGVIGLGSLISDINAGSLRVYNRSSQIGGSYVNVNHLEGSIQGYDGNDDPYNEASPKELHIYSYNPDCLPQEDLLATDSRGSNSLTSYQLDLNNNNFSGFADNFLKFKVVDDVDFEWKNIFFNINGEKGDVKYLISIADFDPIYNAKVGTINLNPLNNTSIGVYNTGTLEFFNHADLNRDGKVNLGDYAILSQNWGRTGIDKGSDPNDLGDYADISGNGSVGIEDLATFSNEWLWEAEAQDS